MHIQCFEAYKLTQRKIEIFIYADDFLVITNHKLFILLIKEKVKIFFKLRG